MAMWPPSVRFTTIDGLESTLAEPVVCDVCNEPIDGEPAGEGVYLWVRAGQPIFEPAPLCDMCATAIGFAVRRQQEIEEEEG
ncbi:MAG: hypothetical protein U0165_00505 [Polyangiaceae bacterium]